jgi:hypothetical protein
MTSSIQTSRLRLDPLRVDDADDMVDHLDDELLHRYTVALPRRSESSANATRAKSPGHRRGG